MKTERNMAATSQNSAICRLDRGIIGVGEADRASAIPTRPTFSIIAPVRDEEAAPPELRRRAAVTDGLDQARGDAVILIDADLQDPPEVPPERAPSSSSRCSAPRS